MRSHIIIYLCILIPVLTYSQNYARDGNYNRAGIQGKLGVININTDNFELEGESAFLAGLTTRGRLYNNFGLLYGIDLLHSSLNIKGRPLGEVQQEDIRYTIIGAQVHILGTYNIIQDRLAIDFGPALLVNGNMKLDQNGQRDNIINGYQSLTAEDIQQISKVNTFGIIGITGGFTHIRLTAQYQVGLGKFFRNLDSQNLLTVDPNARGFKGTASMFTAGIMFLL